MPLAAKIAIFACLAVLASGLFAPGPLTAKEADTFTIGNYPVEASDKNAVAAKDKALADGQQAAFRSLLKRIVPVTAYKQLSRLMKVKAGELVSGVSVRSERNSSTDYIASLDFSYEPQAVRALLQREGIPFVEEKAPQIALIPVLREGNPAESKADTGKWREAWKGLDLEHTLTPAKLEDLKPVIHADTVTMLINGDDSANRILAGEYKSDNVVLAIAEPDLANKKLLITLAGQDAVGPFVLKRTYRIHDGDFGYANELAAVIALGILEGRWKALKSTQVHAAVAAATSTDGTPPAWSAGSVTSPGHGSPVKFVAEFVSLGQWNDIRTQLLDTPGVENLEITTVSARNADVSLNFPGGTEGLANALGSRGLRLQNSQGLWTLTSAR